MNRKDKNAKMFLKEHESWKLHLEVILLEWNAC